MSGFNLKTDNQSSMCFKKKIIRFVCWSFCSGY